MAITPVFVDARVSPAATGASSPPVRASFLASILIVFASLYVEALGREDEVRGFASFGSASRRAVGAAQLSYAVQWVSSGATAFAHSATAVELPGGAVRAFWYGGSREGATDSAVYTALLSPVTGLWDGETMVITPAATEHHLHRRVRKVGNPVVLRDARNRLWLFYVSVSVGGWSGSAINVVVSDDHGKSWSAPRRLVTSPFFNLSTLVKGAPFVYRDGDVGLPVYHEFLGKFGEVLRLDAEGEVVGKTRLSWGRNSLQPVIVPRSASEAVGLMRYAGERPKRILWLDTMDGGKRWSRPQKTSLPNPNAGIGATQLENGELLLAFNNSQDSRDDLSLAHSRNGGKSWRVVHTFERGTSGSASHQNEFSYPWLLRATNGDFHLLYTWMKSRIKHVRFSHTWLRQKL